MSVLVYLRSQQPNSRIYHTEKYIEQTFSENVETNTVRLGFAREVYGFTTQVLIKDMQELDTSVTLCLFSTFPFLSFLLFFSFFFPFFFPSLFLSVCVITSRSLEVTLR